MRYPLSTRVGMLTLALLAVMSLQAAGLAQSPERKPTLRQAVRALAKEADKAVKQNYNWPLESKAAAMIAETESDRGDVLRQLGSNRLDSNPAVDGYIRFHLISYLPGDLQLTEDEFAKLLRSLPQLAPYVGLSSAHMSALDRYKGKVLTKADRAQVNKYLVLYEDKRKQFKDANYFVFQYYDKLEEALPHGPGFELMLNVERYDRHCKAGDLHGNRLLKPIDETIMQYAFDKRLSNSVRSKLIARIKSLARYMSISATEKCEINKKNQLHIKNRNLGMKAEKIDQLTTLLSGRQWEPPKKKK